MRRRPSSLAGLGRGFELFAAGVHHELVGFLDRSRVRTGDDDRGIAEGMGWTAVPTEESDPGRASIRGGLQGGEQIRASARGAEDDESVVGAEQRLALTAEHGFEAVVVRDAGDGSGIRIEADRRDRGTIGSVPTDKFLGEVKSLGGAASIAAGDDPAAAADDRSDGLHDVEEIWSPLVQSTQGLVESGTSVRHHGLEVGSNAHGRSVWGWS